MFLQEGPDKFTDFAGCGSVEVFAQRHEGIPLVLGQTHYQLAVLVVLLLRFVHF